MPFVYNYRIFDKYDRPVASLAVLADSQAHWDRQRILDLLFVLDWMMALPEHLSQALRDNIHTLEQEQKLAYVSTFERLATEEGLQQGIQQGMQQGMLKGEATVLERLLTKRFGPLSSDTLTRLTTATESQLVQWAERILDAPTLAAVFDLH